MKKKIKEWLENILKQTEYNQKEIDSYIKNYFDDFDAYKYLRNVFQSNTKKEIFKNNLIQSIKKFKNNNNCKTDYYIRTINLHINDII